MRVQNQGGAHEDVQKLEDPFVRQYVQDVSRFGVDDG